MSERKKMSPLKSMLPEETPSTQKRDNKRIKDTVDKNASFPSRESNKKSVPQPENPARQATAQLNIHLPLSELQRFKLLMAQAAIIKNSKRNYRYEDFLEILMDSWEEQNEDS